MIGRLLARYQPAWLERVRLGAPLQSSATGELALFMDGAWFGERLMVQLIGKIDEAGTHGDASYMSMGGYAARLEQWNRFDHRWKKGLRKAELPYFHVVEHMGHPFGPKALRIVDRSLMFGFVVRLGKDDYQRFYRDGGWGGKAQPDSMYGLCFRFCLSAVLDIALQELSHDDLVVNFVVEGGDPKCGSAPAIVDQLKRKHISGVSEYLGAAIIGEKTKVPGLQAADLITSGTWKGEKEGLLPTLGPLIRPSLTDWAAHDSKWKVPVLRCHIDREHLSTFKEGYFQHVEMRQAFGEARQAEIEARKQAKASGPSEDEEPS